MASPTSAVKEPGRLNMEINQATIESMNWLGSLVFKNTFKQPTVVIN